MAKRKAVAASVEKVLEEAPRFLLAWHDRPNTVIIGSHLKDVEDLIIPPNFKVVVDEAWKKVPHFVREVQAGTLHTEYSVMVPVNKSLTISPEWEGVLNFNQIEFAKLVCTSEFPFSPQIMENIQLYKLMGPGGVPRANTRVTKRYLQEGHRPMLLATVEMEGRHRNRPEVLKLLDEAVKAIDSL
jgi:hypothetical protein